MSLDDALDDLEPEPCAATFRPLRLPEPIEDVWDLFGGDPGPSVLHPEQDFPIARRRSCRDSAACLRELHGVADHVLEHLEDSVAISPDVGNAGAHIVLKSQGRRSSERLLIFHGVEDELPSGHARWFNGEMASLHTRHVHDVLDEVIHSGRGTLDHFGGLPRSALRFCSAALKETRLHRDGTERISKVMGDETEHLIPDVGRLDRRIVETGILDCESRSLRQRLGQTKIALPVRARPSGGDEREHAEELSTAEEWQRHQRRRVHGAEYLLVLRPLGSRLERVGCDVFDEERPFRIEDRPGQVRAVSIDRHALQEGAKVGF